MSFKVAIKSLCLASLLSTIGGGVAVVEAHTRFRNGDQISSSLHVNKILEGTWKPPETSLDSRGANSDDCAWPYERIADSCLFLLDLREGRAWDWAKYRKVCWALGGDAASFEDMDKLILLIGYMDVFYYGTYFVGGIRYNSTSDFKWVDGSSLPETSSPIWDYRDKDDFNCVALDIETGSYKLRNYDCLTGTGYVQFLWCEQ